MGYQAITCSQVAIDLTPDPIDPSWILEGAPLALSTVLSSSRDLQARVLVWECSPGKVMWHYRMDETILILEGRVVLDDGIGGPKLLGPGHSIFFPAGAVVKWHVQERVRKFAVWRGPLPK